MAEEFKIPDFILEQTADAIHGRMQATMPDDIDVGEGSPFWDAQRSCALEIARFSEYILIETIKQAFPQYATDDYLDYHAEGNGLYRKDATFAKGFVTVSGKEGTEIPAGAIFSTASTTDIESVDFKTLESAVIPASGSVDIPIECIVAGTSGNVAVGTIILKASSLSNSITGVTNATATTGGTDAEDNEALRERNTGVEQTKGVSYVGSKSDYKRWAEEIDGIGEAIVIPAQDDSGTVTIILVDAAGSPASTALCEEVYNHIMGVMEDESDRRTNVNASLIVMPPATVSITVTAIIERDGTVSLEDIKKAYISALNGYLVTASDVGEVKYSRVYSLIAELEGVNDFSSVLMNGSTANVAINKNQLAVVASENITFSDGVVG